MPHVGCVITLATCIVTMKNKSHGCIKTYRNVFFGTYCRYSVFFSIRYQFLADRTNGRAYATVLRLSVVCNVMYCG